MLGPGLGETALQPTAPSQDSPGAWSAGIISTFQKHPLNFQIPCNTKINIYGKIGYQ